MIYKQCIMTIAKNSATLDEDIYLYRLDKNIELHFTIVNNKYKFDKSDLNNIIAQTQAAYFQVRLYKNTDIKYTFAIQPTDDGKAILKITDDLIDDPIEVGEYDFQISLLDADKTSMISMPIVTKQLHVCEPLVSDTALMGKAVLGLSTATNGEIKNAFDSKGNYIREIHSNGEIISAQLFNKFEEALETNTKAIKAGTDGGGTGTGTTVTSIEPQLMDMPRIYFSEGTLPTTKTATVMKFDYYSKTNEYHGYVDIKCQGNSSMSYPKKNFTIKPYKDKAKTAKLKIDFKGWGKQNKFVLKANWIDISHARNVVSARLWGDVIKTRSDYATALPELLRTSPNQGAIDGFPVLVYSNGVYQGRYTLNIPKDKWMSNMDDALDTHCILCGENYVSGCFRALPVINGTDWTDELHDVVPAAIKTSWTNAIKFVMNSSDTEFKANLSNYFDVNSLIDYYIYSLVSTNLDGFGKNQLFFCYDGIHWIASVYDLDSTWGLYWNGSRILPTNYARNQYEDYANKTSNLLYNRLEQLFIAQLKTRYAELRKDVLSASHIIQKFEEFNDVCPKDIVQEDYASTTGGGGFTGIPSKTTNNIQQLRTNIVGRLTYVDGYINALQEAIPCTAITLNKTELTITQPTQIPKDEIINTTYVAGYINRNRSSFNDGTAGTIYISSEKDRTTDFIDITNFSSISYTIPTSTYIGAVAYDSNKKYVKAFDMGTEWANYISGDYQNSTINITSFPENAKYIRFTSFTPDTTNNIIKATILTNIAQEQLTATVTPTDTTDTVVWSVNPTGICTVENGLVTAIKNGACVITATCGTQKATCNVTVSNLPDLPSINYELSEPLVCDGTSTYKDTNIQLLSFNNRDKNWTMLVEFTPTQFSTSGYNVIVHCMKEESPYPGICMDISNNNRRVVIPNNKGLYTGRAPVLNNPVRYALIKQGKLFTVYNEMGTVLGSAETDADITPIDQTLLLGAFQNISDNKGRFFNGTINKFKLVEEIYTVPQIKQYFGMVDNNIAYTLPQEKVFNGTSDFVDTGVQLFKTDRDFTITMDVTADSSQVENTACIIHCMKEQYPYKGITFQKSGTAKFGLSPGNNTNQISDLIDYEQRTKVVIVKNGTTMKVYNSRNAVGESPYQFTALDQTVLLGAYQAINGNKGRFFKGTIHEFSIIDAVYSNEQINAYLGVNVATD